MEFGLKQVALIIFGLVLALPRVSKLLFGGTSENTYWHQVERWKEEDVDFLLPNPIDQSALYRTVKEVEKPLEVLGEGEGLPDWLAGTLIRDGPGLFEFGEFSADHAFDGMAMLRRYQIGPKEDDGSLAMNYSRRLVQSKVLQANMEAQMFTKFGVGTPPSDTSILKRLKGLTEEGGDNVVVQSIVLHGRYYAATEISIVIEYDPETLATIGRRDVADLIPGLKLMTPHPMYDADGTLWNIALCMGPTKDGISTSGWKYVIFKVPPPNSPMMYFSRLLFQFSISRTFCDFVTLYSKTSPF